MSWLLPLVLASTVAPAAAPPVEPAPSAVVRPAPAIVPAADLLAAETRRIRSSERRLTKLIVDGVRRSKTFADLVSRVHQSDVIVYVETSHQLGPETVGRILLQTVAGGQRYLRVQVRALLQGDQIIAVLGHELQHALEVAADRSVVDEATLTGLYRRIGHSSQGTAGFDTDGARAVGIRVRDELIM